MVVTSAAWDQSVHSSVTRQCKLLSRHNIRDCVEYDCIMRSSVSAILSDPAPDNTMSFPDYSQSSSDHATLLVLCQHIGHQLDTSQYHSILDMISQVTEVKVADKGGSVRCVRVRYADRYPVENNEWGEFQVENI